MSLSVRPATAHRTPWVLCLLGLCLLASLLVAGVGSAATGPLAGPGDPRVQDFESAPVGSPPPGCAPNAGALPAEVSDVRGHDSTRALRVRDVSAASRTDLVCTGPTRLGARLRFALYPQNVPNGFLFSVVGRFDGDSGAPRPVFHFEAAADGSLRWYDGGAWQPLAAAGSVQTGRWQVLTVGVPRDHTAAYLWLGGTYLGRAGSTAGQVAELMGYQFSGAGTDPSGDDVFVDDVSFGAPDQSTSVQRGYDAEPLDAVPSGCTTVPGAAAAAVSDRQGHNSPRSLRVPDTSAVSRTEITCTTPGAPQGGLSFAVRPAALPNGFTFGLTGRTQDADTPQQLFHFLIAPDGALKWYDGSGWRPLAPAGTVALGTWTTLSVDVAAAATTAQVSVDGAAVGQSGTAGAPSVADIVGYRFGSAGTAPTGDDVYVDDVSFEGAAAPRTYELGAVGALPPGCTTPSGVNPASISTVRGDQSARSLRVRDSSSSMRTEVDCLTAPREGAEFGFSVHPDALPNGFTVSVLGHFAGTPGAATPVLHLGVTPEGAVRWYDGLGWTELAAPGTVPTGRWSTVRVQVPESQDQAFVRVGGDYVGQAGMWGMREIDDLTGYRLAGSGTAPSGDDVFFDDVTFTSPADDMPAPTGPFQTGETVTVDQAYDSNLQMPNSGVLRPGTGEVLATYTSHADTVEGTGTQLVSTTDAGKSWEKVAARNPFPDEQSFYVTRLSDDRLLAVSYLTHMVSSTGSTQATVRTARSSDGGLTWSHTTGRMTTPTAMRPLPSGVGLGGFVLLNRVLESPDGTLLQSAYGYYADDDRYRQILLVSTDDGVNWSVRSTVAAAPGPSDDPGDEGFDEGSFVRLADGSLLAVMRTGSYRPLHTTTSVDDGRTWTTPRPLLAGPDSRPVVGVRPELTLMGNGTLALLVGRPGMSVLASPDGTGDHWTRPQTIDYRNSGNGTSIPLNSDQLLVIGDRGADWTPHVDEHRRIWSRVVTLRGDS